MFIPPIRRGFLLFSLKRTDRPLLLFIYVGRTDGTVLCSLSGALFQCVLTFILMSVITTLTKEFHTGTLSVWTFIQDSKGKLRAYSNSGKARTFRTIDDVEKCISNFRGYGYQSRSAHLVKQLALF